MTIRAHQRARGPGEQARSNWCWRSLPPSPSQRRLYTAEVRDTMTADGAEPVYNTPEQLGAYIRACHAKWAKVTTTAGLKEKP
jgi:hypothetical protein